ncbi:hypothetical protein DIE18_03205 [Burkholderia sp. Bp9125]|nr:hypothetical protein DIE18_03205 [Burkholderia sp. Bp9125]
MVSTMSQEVVNGRVVWWQTSCRTESDWYAITYEGTILADHLPTKAEAEAAGREVLRQAQNSGKMPAGL